jgi:signal transduction histidine kinase
LAPQRIRLKPPPKHLIHNPRTMVSTVPKSGLAGAAPGVPPATAAQRWRAHAARSAAFVVVLCLAIAALLTAMKGRGFGGNLLYSACIGACCWLFIDAGRHGLAFAIDRMRLARGDKPLPHPGFPGWGWMAALVVVAMVVGPLAGTAAADWVLGISSPNVLNLGSASAQITMVLTVIASVVSVVVLGALERLASARAAAEAAQRAAAENQLKLLESQLEPHMLFNTLANLRVLISLDPPRAQAMLDQLIAFLRATLGASRVAQHPLSAEFARLADYLALMQVRMDQRLQASFDLPDALATCPVPPLLLQPLVENAIKHGLEPQVEGGRIRVSASREGGQLVLQVRDTGAGLSATAASATEGTRFGLTQVRARLATLYGERATLQLVAAPDTEGGTLAIIRLPLGAD